MMLSRPMIRSLGGKVLSLKKAKSNRIPFESISTLCNCFFVPCESKVDDKREKDRLVLLYQYSMPRIQIIEMNKTDTVTKRWKSTTTGPTSADESLTNLNSKIPSPTESTGLEHDSNHSLRSRLQDRADNYRESAKCKYKEFREDPKNSAKAGAKSIGGMVRMYGPVFIGTYASIYFGTLGAFYAGVQSSLLDPVALFSLLGHSGDDQATTVQFVVDFMNSHTITKPYSHIVQEYPSVANLAVAWIAVKFTEPIRLALAFAVTPKVSRYFGYTPKHNDANDEHGNTSTTKTDSTKESTKS